MGSKGVDVKADTYQNTSTTVQDAQKKAKDDDELLDKAKHRNFWRILTYSTRLDWLLMGLATICSIGAGVALPLMNIVFGNLTADFNDYFIPGSNVTKDQFLDSVNRNALYIVYLFIGKFCLAYVSMFSFRITGIRISAALRLAYIKALFVQPISVFDKLPPGKPTSMITSSSNTIQIGISEKLAILVQAVALIVTAYVIAFRYSWALTLVSSSTILFISLVYGMIVPIFLKQLRLVEHSNEKASSIAGESFGAIRTIVACGAEDRLASRYAEWIKKSRLVGLKMSPTSGAQFSPVYFAMYSDYALTFWYGVQLYNGNHITNAGTVVTVFFSVLIVVATIGNIASPIIGISKAASASTGFFTMLDKPQPRTGGYKEPEVSAHEDIWFQDVTFSYPSRPDVTVLKNLSVQFPTGQVTAIVGPSGSGKSTIVGLLERWYHITEQSSEGDGSQSSSVREKASDDTKDSTDVKVVEPNSGSIMIGKYEIQSLDLKWWRSQIGFVQQEPFTFNATIYTNVSYGLVGSKWEHEDDATKLELVEEACKEAFADEFINRLPLGYQTLVGDNGIKLSGGQRQRLAIARSIIKQPKILILDEATSAIDVRSEIIVQQALDRVSKNRTTISIAHRLSTVKKAAKIVVLKDGAIVEQGTHQSLLANSDGLYYGLVRAQQLNLDEPSEAPTIKDKNLEIELASSTKDEKNEQDDTIDVRPAMQEDEYKQRGLIRAVGLFLYEQRTHWLLYLMTVVVAAGCGATLAVQSFLFAELIQVFQYFGQKLLDAANFWSLMFFIEAIGVGVCYFVLGWTANSISVYISTTYRQQYYENILRKPMRFYDAEENSAGTLTSRLSTDPTQLQELLGANMALPLIAIFNVTGCIAISFAFGWKLTLVTMFSAFPIIFLAAFIRLKFELQFEKLNAAVFAESAQFASEAIGAFRTVTALTLEDTITNRYSALLNGQVKNAWIKARLATLIFAASDSVELLGMALCFWYGGRLLSTYEYNVVQFFVIYVAIVQGGQGAGQWASFAPNMAQASAAANRIISLRPSTKTKAIDPTGLITDTEGGIRIEFRDAYFKYPTRDVPVFKGLNITIEKGQFAALVGPSGCGKTSIVSLLERFYDLQSGDILINNTSISTLEIAAYRKHISLVSQEPTLFQGTIRDNLLLGVDASSVTDEDMYVACRAAEIHDFVMSLPEGYSTDPGLRATALSVGQTQRLTLARALLRSPHLLLLDEATSSLDSASEKLVQAALERAAKGRTMLVVAHRLATVQRADVIYVMEEGGQVVEKGRHGELVRKGGVYAGMCRSQALDR